MTKSSYSVSVFAFPWAYNIMIKMIALPISQIYLLYDRPLGHFEVADACKHAQDFARLRLSLCVHVNLSKFASGWNEGRKFLRCELLRFALSRHS